MTDFRKLRVWHSAQQFAIDANKTAKRIRRAGNLKLSDQLARSAKSVPSNIVEGCEDESPREFARFLRYSKRSLSESEGHIQLAFDLELIGKAEYDSLIDQVVETRKMLCGLLKRLESGDRYGRDKTA
jgi:four helix bundle protein